MKKLLWLDDYRNPNDKETDWMVFSCIGKGCEVYWVKSYDEFTKWITENGLPDGVNFDHDLADEHYTPEKYWSDYEASKEYQDAQDYKEKTGLDCARWLCEYCDSNNLSLPFYAIHSANPVGADNIRNFLGGFKKYLAQQKALY